MGNYISSSTTYSEEELLESLKEEWERLGRTPTIEDIVKSEDMPPISAYMDNFDTHSDAIRELKEREAKEITNTTSEEAVGSVRRETEKHRDVLEDARRKRKREEEIMEVLRNDFVNYAGQIRRELDADISSQTVAQICLNSSNIEVEEKTSKGNKYKVKDSE